MDPVPRCGHVFPEWPVVICDEPIYHPGDHTGLDPMHGRWAWFNEDDD